jgi:predicted alpha/beta hydrolase family esterase
MKRVFIVHGWDGSPNEGWFPWLKRNLKKAGYKVEVPKMPHASTPRINAWVSKLKKITKRPDEVTYFVGHSIGCQTILRYLETLPKNTKIGGAVFVAGWFTLKNLETKEERAIAKPWMTKPIDYKKVKRFKRFTALFSSNDPFVPRQNEILFRKRLGAKIIRLQNKGHFSGSDNIKKLPIVLKEIKTLIKR